VEKTALKVAKSNIF